MSSANETPSAPWSAPFSLFTSFAAALLLLSVSACIEEPQDDDFEAENRGVEEAPQSSALTAGNANSNAGNTGSAGRANDTSSETSSAAREALADGGAINREVSSTRALAMSALDTNETVQDTIVRTRDTTVTVRDTIIRVRDTTVALSDTIIIRRDLATMERIRGLSVVRIDTASRQQDTLVANVEQGPQQQRQQQDTTRTDTAQLGGGGGGAAVNLNSTIEALRGGVTNLATGRAVNIIQGWQQRLRNANNEQLTGIADDLEQLAGELQADDIDEEEAGELMRQLGRDTRQSASNASGQTQQQRLRQLGTALLRVGQQLSQQ